MVIQTNEEGKLIQSPLTEYVRGVLQKAVSGEAMLLRHGTMLMNVPIR